MSLISKKMWYAATMLILVTFVSEYESTLGEGNVRHPPNVSPQHYQQPQQGQRQPQYAGGPQYHHQQQQRYQHNYHHEPQRYQQPQVPHMFQGQMQQPQYDMQQEDEYQVSEQDHMLRRQMSDQGQIHHWNTKKTGSPVSNPERQSDGVVQDVDPMAQQLQRKQQDYDDIEHEKLTQHLQHRAMQQAAQFDIMAADSLKPYGSQLGGGPESDGGGRPESGNGPAEDGAAWPEKVYVTYERAAGGVGLGSMLLALAIVLLAMTLIYIAIRKYSKSRGRPHPRPHPRSGHTNSRTAHRVDWGDGGGAVSSRLYSPAARSYSGPGVVSSLPKVHVALALSDPQQPHGAAIQPHLTVNPAASATLRARSRSPNTAAIQPQCV